MEQKNLRHLVIKKETHAKFKLYSQLSGIKMYELADKAINEYMKRHPLKGEKQDKWFEELVKSM
mgnify:CR=1 FL=1